MSNITTENQRQLSIKKNYLGVRTLVAIQTEEIMGENEKLAKLFHESYERLAPNYGYKTREASAKPWSEVPKNNKDLMIAVCAEVIGNIHK